MSSSNENQSLESGEDLSQAAASQTVSSWITFDTFKLEELDDPISYVCDVLFTAHDIYRPKAEDVDLVIADSLTDASNSIKFREEYEEKRLEVLLLPALRCAAISKTSLEFLRSIVVHIFGLDYEEYFGEKSCADVLAAVKKWQSQKKGDILTIGRLKSNANSVPKLNEKYLKCLPISVPKFWELNDNECSL
jgi:hypothetical protein